MKRSPSLYMSKKKIAVPEQFRSRNMGLASADIKISKLIDQQRTQQSSEQIKRLKVSKMQKIFWKEEQPMFKSVDHRDVVVTLDRKPRYRSQQPIFRVEHPPQGIAGKRNKSLANLLCCMGGNQRDQS